MRVTVERIRALGLDWPADRVDADGSVDLVAAAKRIDAEYAAAENAYFASLGKPGGDAARDRYFALRDLGTHAAVVRALVSAIGDRSLGVGPIPRETIDGLGLMMGPVLTEKLVAAGSEVDPIKTMERLVADYRYYEREYDGLSAQRRSWGASRDDVSDRWDELSQGMADNDGAIRELSAILAAVCK